MQRTQIYLEDDQRQRLDVLADAEGVSMAEVVRRAIDEYLARPRRELNREEWLERTLGALPELEIPSRSEWERGYG
jgi:predicted transcriptional regulator